jgi:hypothetical protein
MSLTLDWMIGIDDNWCSLDAVDLSNTCFDRMNGVFIVWYGPGPEGGERRVVAVGHGYIRNKLGALREDPVITRYAKKNLLVSWAEVDREHQPGVENYLTAMLQPLHNEAHPHAVQTLVNLPPW